MVLPLLLLLFCSAWTMTEAADPDVSPSEFIVPQCTVLTVAWGQPPPIHLHVQPGSAINVSNLVDLGILSGSTTTFTVALPIGQQFTFAYNTIAQQFTVFVSNLMQVGPGTTDCLPGQSSSTSPPPPPPPPTTTSPKTTSTTTPTSKSDAPTTTSKGAPASTTSSPSPSSSSSSTSFASAPPPPIDSGPSSNALDSNPTPSAFTSVVPAPSSTKALPVGAVVGGILALAVVIAVALVVFLCYRRRRGRAANLTLAPPGGYTDNPNFNPDSLYATSVGSPPPTSIAAAYSDMVQAPGSFRDGTISPYQGSDVSPYQGSRSTAPHPTQPYSSSKAQLLYHQNHTTSPSVSTAAAQEEPETRAGDLFGTQEEEDLPPAYDHAGRRSVLVAGRG